MFIRAFARQEETLAMQCKRMNQQWNWRVRVNIVASSVFSAHPSVPEQDHRSATLGASITRTDVERASGFGPLKTLLQAISAVYANCEVSPRLFA